MDLILENVRSFAGRHYFPIKPLTILVGENSSGKTTCLASLSAIFGSKGFPMRPAFNEPPYDLGSFDTIASYKGGRYGRAKYFCLGYREDGAGADQHSEVLAKYVGKLGQPVLSEFRITSPKGNLSITVEDHEIQGEVWLPQSKEAKEVRIPFKQALSEGAVLDESALNLALLGSLSPQRLGGDMSIESVTGALVRIQALVQVGFGEGETVLSIAPVRTRPRRTYDEISDEFKPEGDHIPLILARVYENPSTEEQRQQLWASLTQFGKVSGLFKNISVKRLGRKPSDPFQILVTIAGQPSNLPDVGYGVSQSLPVVVQSVLVSKGRSLLLQQPEVHLHPRAQAALGTFMSWLVATREKRVVIETHSDYLVDRVRWEVAQGTLKPELVSLLYFERKTIESRVHALSLDSHGNILGAPDSYREFFLREEMDLLTRTPK